MTEESMKSVNISVFLHIFSISKEGIDIALDYFVPGVRSNQEKCRERDSSCLSAVRQ